MKNETFYKRNGNIYNKDMQFTFSDAWNFYFHQVCDVTWLLSIGAYSLFLIILDWPKKWSLKNVLLTMIKYIGFYSTYLMFGSVTFALDRILLFDSHGLLFSMPVLIITPVIYSCWFIKEKLWHRFVKLSTLCSSYIICFEISRIFGIVCGEITQNNFIAVVLARFLPVTLSFSICIIMRLYDISRYKTLPTPLVVIMLIVSYSMMIGVIAENIIRIENSQVSVYVIFIFLYLVLLLVLNITYYSIFNTIQSRHRMTEKEVQATLSDAERQAMELDNINREELAKLRHDLNNQFGYLQTMLDNNQIEEAKSYLLELTESKRDSLESFSCSNEVISAIINLELSKAKMNNVKMKAKVTVPPGLPFADTDLVSLITNICDNAIEEMNRSKEEGQVSLTIITYQDYFRVNCTNPVPVKDSSRALALMTKKGNKRRHGYGTKIVKNIVNKYNGHVSYSYENGKFVCDVIITMNTSGGNEDVKNSTSR